MDYYTLDGHGIPNSRFLIYNWATMIYINEFLKHWRRCVLLMILCGAAGYLISEIQPRSYRATVYLTTAIDHNRTGSLDELEEDRMLGIAEDIINSDVVFQTVCQNLDFCTPKDFRQSIQIERTIDLWALTVFSKDPADAVTRARLWLETAYDALIKSQNHAIRAEALKIRLDGFESCIQDSVSGNPPAVCAEADFETLLENIRQTAETIQQEQLLSNGISSAVMFGPLNPGHILLQDSRSTRGILTLIGSFIGLLLSGLLVFLLPADKEKGKQAVSGTPSENPSEKILFPSGQDEN